MTSGESYAFSYGYNFVGAVTSETYPSERVVTTAYGAANRVNSVAGSLGSQQTPYASNRQRFERLEPAVRLRCVGQHVGGRELRRESGRQYAYVHNANNQNGGGSYDNAGNNLVVNGFTLVYDAENRQISATEQPSLGSGQELYL